MTTPTPPLDLEAARAVQPGSPLPYQEGVAGSCNLVQFDGYDIHGIAKVWRLEDLAYLVHAANTLPQALTELKREREEVERLRKALEGLLPLIEHDEECKTNIDELDASCDCSWAPPWHQALKALATPATADAGMGEGQP